MTPLNHGDILLSRSEGDYWMLMRRDTVNEDEIPRDVWWMHSFSRGKEFWCWESLLEDEYYYVRVA